mmetsp:Transcript_8820/g.13947  ORF Transcript_8820/g.13947 Transcript_8820/m.13947 type:complete len:412 (+) Transcript_8820:220-1455(+)
MPTLQQQQQPTSPASSNGHRHAEGRRLVGRVSRNHAGPSSIPSKFETILFHGQKEAKGFISGSLRFKHDKAYEGPGPGAYSVGGLSSKSTESFSKKGYGNLASSSNRFHGPRPSYYPGPGENNWLSSVKGSRVQNHRHVFASKSLRIPQARRDNTVGPGQYYTRHSPTKVYVYRSPSGGNPRNNPKAAELLNHEQLNSGEALREREMPMMQTGFNMCDSRFPKRKIVKSPEPGTYDPIPVSSSVNPAHSSFKSTKQRNFELTRTPKDMMLHMRPYSNPGPGRYDDGQYWRLVRDKKPQKNFIKNDSDRFGRPLQRKSTSMPPTKYPGPGHYNPAVSVSNSGNSKMAKSWINRVRMKSRQEVRRNDSVFASKAIRATSSPIVNAPGPAYYKLGSNKKKSHNAHANASRVWVS